MDVASIATLIQAGSVNLIQTIILLGLAGWVWKANTTMALLTLRVESLERNINACGWHKFGRALTEKGGALAEMAE